MKRWIEGLLAAGLLLAGVAQAQTVEYIHTDALGSVVAVTDANRNVIERREYEPYGHQLTPTVANGPGYTGHVQDAATGLVYMQQRYYDGQIGRFLSVDPVTAHEKPGQNFNRYWYANNSPYKFTDPDGRASEMAMERFADSVGQNPEAFKVLEGPAVALTGIAVTMTVGPIAGMAFKQFANASRASTEASGPTVAGVQVGKTPSEARATLEKAGFEGKPVTNPSGSEVGTVHNVPGMKMDVRVMDGGKHHPPRIVTTREGAPKQPVNPADGKNFGNIPKADQRTQSHITLKKDLP